MLSYRIILLHCSRFVFDCSEICVCCPTGLFYYIVVDLCLIVQRFVFDCSEICVCCPTGLFMIQYIVVDLCLIVQIFVYVVLQDYL